MPALTAVFSSKMRFGSVVLMACLQGLPAHALQPYKADYVFNIDNKFNGQSSRVLTQNRQGWLYTFNAKVPVLASATETSQFMLTPDQNVLSVNHTLNYKILVKTKKSSMVFHPTSHMVNVQHNGKASRYAGRVDALDDLNLEIQVREDLKRGKLKTEYWLADEKDIEPVRFINEGKTKVTTPAGTFDAYAIRRVHKRPTLTSTFWLAPALDYLPVKVVQKDDGTIYEFSLTTYQPMPATSVGAQSPTSTNTAR
jgi:hypothetical protein